MDPVPALTESEALARLVRRLEPEGQDLSRPDDLDCSIAVAVPDRDDPGRRTAVLVAGSKDRKELVPPAWLRENKDGLSKLLRESKIGRGKVIIPGSAPERPDRPRINRSSLRVISAVDYLWIDKLRVHDSQGNRDSKRHEQLLAKLGSRWRDDEESDYTEPSLGLVDATAGSGEILDRMRQGRPDLPTGMLAVLYGPGGIGKTFFLRRLSDRLRREAVRDPTLGIPVFAELPVLLHTDALETWLGRSGIGLNVEMIGVLISEGVIIPVLDALDELVRGQAREGSRAFLEHLADLVGRRGRGLLSSRDYFLNIDPLVRDSVSDDARVECSVGYFDARGRRRYLQMRSALKPEGAARWAGRLEDQTKEVLTEASEADLDELIGHPVFLDALCGIIQSYPEEDRVAAADRFEVTSPDVFGEIFTRILERERGKAHDQWAARFDGKLVGDWADPFTPELQRKVFETLVLRVAAEGGREALRRSASDPRFATLRHGLFISAEESSDGSAAALGHLLREILGEPEVDEKVPDDDREKVRSDALDELVAFYRQHTLVDTGPDNPEELVLATRHRAYFDYLLGQALIKRLRDALSTPEPGHREDFVMWCLEHHIFERSDSTDSDPPFASCLDFVTWDREGLRRAYELIDDMFAADPPPDGFLASYVASLALAVLLRATPSEGTPRVQERRFRVTPDEQLELVSNVAPVVSSAEIRRCSFPHTLLSGITLREVLFEDSDIEQLELKDVACEGVRFKDCTVDSLILDGKLTIVNSHLDFAPEEFDASGVRELMIRSTAVNPELRQKIEEAAAIRPDCFRLVGLESIQPPTEQDAVNPGQFFVNRLVSLMRRHGHDEFAVFGPKLRGRSRATGETFPKALEVLERRGVITIDGDMLYLSLDAEQHRYDGKERPDSRTFADVRDYWDPIAQDLDEVL